MQIFRVELVGWTLLAFGGCEVQVGFGVAFPIAEVEGLACLALEALVCGVVRGGSPAGTRLYLEPN